MSKPTYDDLARAFISMLDGNSDPADIQRFTGLPTAECQRIHDIYCQLIADPPPRQPSRMEELYRNIEARIKGAGNWPVSLCSVGFVVCTAQAVIFVAVDDEAAGTYTCTAKPDTRGESPVLRKSDRLSETGVVGMILEFA